MASAFSVNQSWYDELRHDYDSGRRWIRLLTLQPGTFGDEIACDMYLVDLEPTPQYDALSYCWGSDTLSSTITLNGRPGFKVTNNLISALRRVRRQEVVRILWVDAICINQADVREKTTHVRNMDFIYSNAFEVCIYLGECELLDFDHRTGEWKQSASARRQHCHRELREAQQSLGYWDQGHCQNPKLQLDRQIKGLKRNLNSQETILNRLFPLMDCKPPVCEAFAKEFGEHIEHQLLLGVSDEMRSRLSWWRRLWTVQECLLAKRPRVYCGPYDMSWSSARLLWGGDGAWTMSQSSNMTREIGIMDNLRRLGPLDLHSLLLATSDKQCVKPRDRVYALVGAIQHDSQTCIELDYDVEVHQTHIQAAFHIIRTSKDFSILFSQWDRSSAIFCHHELFSWIPNLGHRISDRTTNDLAWEEKEPCIRRREQGRWEGARVRTVPDLNPQAFDRDTLESNKAAKTLLATLSSKAPCVALTCVDGSCMLSIGAFLFDTIISVHQLGDDSFSEIVDAVPDYTRHAVAFDSKCKAYVLLTLLTEACCLHHDAILHDDNGKLDLLYACHRRESYREASLTPDDAGDFLRLLDECLRRPWFDCLRGPLAAQYPQWIESTDADDQFKNHMILMDLLEAIKKDRTWSGKFFVTAKGYIGIGPEAAQPGDVIAVFLGARSPYILRKVGDAFALLGDSYVLGLMNGEFKQLEAEGGLQIERIMLL